MQPTKRQVNTALDDIEKSIRKFLNDAAMLDALTDEAYDAKLNDIADLIDRFCEQVYDDEPEPPDGGGEPLADAA